MTVLGTGISWTNSTWNPWVGCRPVSAGCDNCYAATLVNGPRGGIFGHRFEDVKLHLGRLPQVRRFKPITKGKARFPHMVFVNSMSDFFFEDVPDAAIHQTLDVLEANPDTIFQVLSKRPIRARKLIVDRYARRGVPHHIWFGFTAETNAVAKRVEILRGIKDKVGSMIAFLSVEPIVGPTAGMTFEDMDWIITGGESGPRCRVMQRDWLWPAVNAAVALDIPLWHKQHGHIQSHPNLHQVPAEYRKTQWQAMDWLVGHGLELLREEKGGATIDGHTYRALPAVYHEMTERLTSAGDTFSMF